MTSQGGTYAFGSFSSNKTELARLERQAAVAWDLERGMLEQAGLRPGMDVLDLACGPGFISSRIAQLVQPGGTVVGADVNEELLAIAQHRRDAGQAEGVTFRKMDVYEPDLPESSFDFVYARFLFQHLQSPQRAIEQAKRLLRPGGRVCLVDSDDDLLCIFPEPTGFRDFTRLAARYQQEAGGDRTAGRKLGYYLKAAGFEDLAIRVAMVTGDQIGMKPFLDITTGFKHELVPQELRQAVRVQLATIYEQAQQPGTFAQVGVFFVSARKP